MNMANYLDGVELLDLDLDPGDVVVVEVLHLLQLVFQPVFCCKLWQGNSNPHLLTNITSTILTLEIIFLPH